MANSYVQDLGHIPGVRHLEADKANLHDVNHEDKNSVPVARTNSESKYVEADGANLLNVKHDDANSTKVE